MADHPEWAPIRQQMGITMDRALSNLQDTWEAIGVTREMRLTYYKQAYDHVECLFQDMENEAEMKKQQLLENIKNLLEQTTSLCKELNLNSKSYDQIPVCEVEQMLKDDLKNLSLMKEERLKILDELLIKEQDICSKLGCQKLNIAADVVLAEEELESFKLYLQKQENEKMRLENVFIDIRRSIIKMMDDLSIFPSSPFERLICNNPEEFVLNASNMTKLIEFRDELNIQVEDTKCHVEKMKEDLIALWKYLDEPVEVYESFLEKHSGYSTSTVNALEAEIKRCKEKRKENILKYVQQIRCELVNLWDFCKLCEAERSTFAPFHSTTFTEDLLMLHELEVERLRKFYNDNRPIFDLLEQRENLIMKIKELLQRANNADPNRYHNRGGQLLTEEKERRVIQKKLPKIEAELKKLIKEYETKHNQVFTIYGTPLESIIAETWENINHEKETLKKARKEAKDKSSKKSPLNSSKRTPGMSYLSVHRGPVLGLSKRKLFSPSPNSSIKRRNKNGDKNKPTVPSSKVRRSGKLPKIQKPGTSSKGGQRRRESLSPNNNITDTTYNQFQGHMTNREELHSSLLPEQILRGANKANVKKTPVRTPMKPLRKHLSATTTPVTFSSARKEPHSPRVVNTPKLTVSSNLPFIF